MYFIIGIVGFYATWFVASQYGVSEAVVVAGCTVGAIFWWRYVEQKREAEAKRETEQKYRSRKSAELSSFVGAGRFFVGRSRTIYEFEHANDAMLEIVSRWPEWAADCVCYLKTRRGIIAAMDPSGWPKQRPVSDVQSVLDYVTIHVGEEVRCSIEFVPKTEQALAIEANRRTELAQAVKSRVGKRASELSGRTRDDVGSDGIAVYVITPTNRRASKVGISQNPAKRLKDLQTGSPSVLAIASVFWMRCRADAQKLEFETHRTLLAKGHKRTGEWFPVDEELARQAVRESYDFLIERNLIETEEIEVSDAATDTELAQLVARALPWRQSKRGNLYVGLDGRRITVFQKRGGWSWVVDGAFGPVVETVDDAKSGCMSMLAPSRETCLRILLGQDDNPNR